MSLLDANGWEKFIEDNNVELGDFFIFDYNGSEFDFKLLGRSGCEKKGVGGLRLAVNVEEEGEMNTEHLKGVEPKEKNWANDSNNNSFYNDTDKDYMVEEEDDENEDKEYKVVVEEDKEEIEKISRSKHRYVEEEEEEDNNERAGTFEKKEPQCKAGCKKAIASKMRDRHDYFGADIFKSGRATQPQNPYFVAKIRSYRGDEVFVPVDVVRDNKLELPSCITIRDLLAENLRQNSRLGKMVEYG
ncbi:hypothetical protein HAX54_017582 [Datura stramonium]|uniref:TF-B3 domain-containing protein n=1 Tax=Datura stramonium TaxID=4076 RepID=A0ABS8S0R7_DATST|nr:hypothetical protein [Datura stramonium]